DLTLWITYKAHHSFGLAFKCCFHCFLTDPLCFIEICFAGDMHGTALQDIQLTTAHLAMESIANELFQTLTRSAMYDMSKDIFRCIRRIFVQKTSLTIADSL